VEFVSEAFIGTTGAVYRVVFGRKVCANRGWVASVPWESHSVNNLLRIASPTQPHFSTSISIYAPSNLSHLPLRIPPHILPHVRLPLPPAIITLKFRLRISRLTILAMRLWVLDACTTTTVRTTPHSTSHCIIRTSLFPAAFLLASEDFPAPVLALNGRVDVAFHAPATCMDDVLGQILGEVEYDEDIPHLISPAVLQRREARLQGPGLWRW
jgi:hypothetical protein